MKLIYLKTPVTKIILGIFFLISLFSCNNQNSSNSYANAKTTAESEVQKAIATAYNYYTKSDIRWVDFYNDKYTVITGDGTALTMYADSLRKNWLKRYKNYDVIVLNHGQPTVIASENQALHFNTASEMFINKTTNDTTKNGAGTWIALWKKQNDNSWKIVWETYQTE